MSRVYSARLIALTLGVPLKWLDNLLSHNEVPGVAGGRQGVERRITDQGLLAIELTRLLASELGVPLARAAAIARNAQASRADDQLGYVTDSGITVAFPVAAIEARLRERVVAAVEGVGHVPRGRPRRRRSASE